MVDYEAIKSAMSDLEEDSLYDMLREALDEGEASVQTAVEACQAGMMQVGDRFESGEYFVGDLIFAGDILSRGMEIIMPALGGKSGESLGKMILCTVHSDLHDIGKNIVKAILEATGFEVIDLGIDTPVEKIVNTAREQDIHIIGLSGVLTLALDSMKDTVDGFKAAGMRDSVKIIIGGNPVNEAACKSIGADAWAHSPQRTAEICKGWAQA